MLRKPWPPTTPLKAATVVTVPGELLLNLTRLIPDDVLKLSAVVIP
jgi:hypothetical protein